jgi:hypothetical protein
MFARWFIVKPFVQRSLQAARNRDIEKRSAACGFTCVSPYRRTCESQILTPPTDGTDFRIQRGL